MQRKSLNRVAQNECVLFRGNEERLLLLWRGFLYCISFKQIKNNLKQCVCVKDSKMEARHQSGFDWLALLSKLVNYM